MSLNWLKEQRLKYGFTQQRTANLVGITVQYYNCIENGRRRPSPRIAKKIANILGFSSTWYILLEAVK